MVNGREVFNAAGVFLGKFFLDEFQGTLLTGSINLMQNLVAMFPLKPSEVVEMLE